VGHKTHYDRFTAASLELAWNRIRDQPKTPRDLAMSRARCIQCQEAVDQDRQDPARFSSMPREREWMFVKSPKTGSQRSGRQNLLAGFYLAAHLKSSPGTTRANENIPTRRHRARTKLEE
jgi:hypothetical protein